MEPKQIGASEILKSSEYNAGKNAGMIDSSVSDSRALIHEECELNIEALEEVIEKRNNLYLANKSVAQGMMDVALLTANCNQLKFVLQYYKGNSVIYNILVTFISLSIIIQVIIGIMLIFKGRMDYEGHDDETKQKEKEKHSIKMNNIIVVLVFFVTVINVFIGAFSTDTN